MPDFQAIVMDSVDTVATAVATLPAGEIARVVLPDGTFQDVRVSQAIPFGHKFAIQVADAGQPAIKYGERIGLMNAGVQVGDHVHVHNLESERGRGDLKERDNESTWTREGNR